MPMSQPVFVDLGRNNGSHCKLKPIVQVAKVVQGEEDGFSLRAVSADVVLTPLKI